jgi:DNA-binding MarR family transcriptional regulator
MDLEFFDAVVGYEIALWEHLDAQLNDAGDVSLAVFSALRVVERHHGAARIRELQDDLRITVGSASKLADRLERDGLVLRRQNPEDRRSSQLELTVDGRNRYEAADVTVRAALNDHLHSSGTRPRDVVDALRRLDAALTATAST